MIEHPVTFFLVIDEYGNESRQYVIPTGTQKFQVCTHYRGWETCTTTNRSKSSGGDTWPEPVPPIGKGWGLANDGVPGITGWKRRRKKR